MREALHARAAPVASGTPAHGLWALLATQSERIAGLLDASRQARGVSPLHQLEETLGLRLDVDQGVLLPALAALHPSDPVHADNRDARLRIQRLRELASRLADPALSPPARQLLLGVLEGLWQLHEAVMAGELSHHHKLLPWPQLLDRAGQLLAGGGGVRT